MGITAIPLWKQDISKKEKIQAEKKIMLKLSIVWFLVWTLAKNTVCPTCYRTRLAGGPLLRVATIRRNTDTFLFISHTTNVLLFKFRCNIFIGVRIIKEMQGSVASGTHCIYCILYCLYCVFVLSRLCIFILICSVCSSVRSAAIEWKLNWSKQ